MRCRLLGGQLVRQDLFLLINYRSAVLESVGAITCLGGSQVVYLEYVAPHFRGSPLVKETKLAEATDRRLVFSPCHRLVDVSGRDTLPAPISHHTFMLPKHVLLQNAKSVLLVGQLLLVH